MGRALCTSFICVWGAAKMKKYEYECIWIWAGREKTKAILNSYGEKGWELVFVISAWHYLKREII